MNDPTQWEAWDYGPMTCVFTSIKCACCMELGEKSVIKSLLTVFMVKPQRRLTGARGILYICKCGTFYTKMGLVDFIFI